MKELPIIEVRGQRVLSTKQIAEAYGADTKTIQYNFRYNRGRYIEGKHFIELKGEDLRRLKTRSEFQSLFKYAKSLYLWTEKGALLHAKSLNTDKAWEVYDYLVDFYFRVKERVSSKVPVKNTARKATKTVVDIPRNAQILKAFQKVRNDLICMDVLLEECIKCSSKEKYYAKQKAAVEVVTIIVNDCNRLLETSRM